MRSLPLLVVLTPLGFGQSVDFLDQDLGSGHVASRGTKALFGNVLWNAGETELLDLPEGSVSALDADASLGTFAWSQIEPDLPQDPRVFYGGLLDLATGVATPYFGLPRCLIPGKPPSIHHTTGFGIDDAGTAAYGIRPVETVVDGPFGPMLVCESFGAYLKVDEGAWREAPDDALLFCISGDGTRVGGRAGDDCPVLFDISGDEAVEIPLGFTEPIYGRVDTLSPDGKRARVITQEIGGIDQVWWWSEAGGLVPGSPDALGRLPVSNFSFTIDHFLVWEEETNGVLTPDDFFVHHGIDAFVEDWTVFRIGEVDARGRTISGSAAPVAGGERRSFVVRLPPWRRYGVDLGEANVLDLFARGALVMGGALELEVTTSPGSLVLFYLASDFSAEPFLGGTLLVDPLSIFGTRLATSSARGTASLQVSLPPDPSLKGLELYAQAVSPDPTQSQNWAFSNGLRAVVGEAADDGPLFGAR